MMLKEQGDNKYRCKGYNIKPILNVGFPLYYEGYPYVKFLTFPHILVADAPMKKKKSKILVLPQRTIVFVR